MQTKICLLGDSHAAALRQGWFRIHRNFPQFEICFFAGLSEHWPSVTARDGALVAGSETLQEQFARSSRGIRVIAADYDAYVVSSLRLAISFPLRLWTRQGITEWGAYREAVTKSVHETACADVLSKLRQITAAPIFVLAAPHQPAGYCKSSPLLDLETAHRVGANFTAACEELAAKHAAVFIPQPLGTLAPNRVTTRMEFANPPSSSERDDSRHCNAEYGALALTEVLQTILKTTVISN